MAILSILEPVSWRDGNLSVKRKVAGFVGMHAHEFSSLKTVLELNQIDQIVFLVQLVM